MRCEREVRAGGDHDARAPGSRTARLHGDDGAGEKQLDDSGVQAGVFGADKIIGSRLRGRTYETHIVLLDGMVVLAELPLRGGNRAAVIDFRHIIK